MDRQLHSEPAEDHSDGAEWGCKQNEEWSRGPKESASAKSEEDLKAIREESRVIWH